MTSNQVDIPTRMEFPGNLPAEPNAFIGRERDLADLVSMVGRARMLTLFGPGGIGKTRLALKLAASLANDYQGGAWVADLADADAPERLVPLVAAALGIRAEPERKLADTLVEALRPRAMLLVLDTCEHVVQPAAELAQRLLSSCPGLRVIATSREALRVRGEVIWRVPPLGLPGPVDARQATDLIDALPHCEAVSLFLARAAAVRPGFRLHAGNAVAVAEICRTLGGVPLAIELAAARVRTLSAAEIGARLARFELLALGDRTAPPRQQTLRATVEWSYDLLTEPEQTLLSRLSVFSGWSLEMAEQVCADSRIPAPQILDLLTALIDKSLVSVEPELNGVGRYRLLDTVRALAAEHAEADHEMPRLRAAHRDCMLAMALAIVERAFVRGDPPWPERVAMYHRVLAERANFHLALAYCVQHGDAEAGLRLCHALSGSWLASGDVSEGAHWIDQLLVIAGQTPDGVRARALAVRAELAFEQQDYPGAARFAAACLHLSQASGDGNPATALRLQALTSLMAGQAHDALPHADAALSAARQMRDDWEEGVALASRAAVLAGQGELAQAQAGYVEALAVLSGNNRWGVANVLYGLGQLARARGEAGAAVRYFGDALAIYREIDAKPEMARCLGGIGLVALSQPDHAMARSSLAESVRLNLATGQRLGIARGLAALAALYSAEGDQSRAARLAGAAYALFEVIGVAAAAAVRRLDGLVSAAGSQIGPAAAAALVSQGRALTPQDALALATAPASGGHELVEPGGGQAAGRDLAAPPPADAGGPDQDGSARPPWPGPLTGREVEVAILVARGLSNRAIGEQLFISQTTAARHVANIFSKLGFSSRSQLASWVIKSAPSQ
jgi:predicted ATPase/DNA-binding CsgD family transcriptional regulator/tetratricopeptide (TPR) repeat protein